MATMQDVARKAGVSVTLVSRYLNNVKGVGPESKEKIKKAIAELNYRPNALARSLVRKKTGTIGVITDQLCTPFIFDLIRGLEAGAASWESKDEYRCIFCNADNNSGKKLSYIQFLTEGLADGVVIYGSGHSDDDLIRQLAETNFPFVLIENDYRQTEVNKVLVDNFNGAYQATQSLIAAGHRRIAHFAGELNIKVSLDRLNGFVSAMQDHGIPIEKELILNANFTEESGYEQMKALLDKGVCPDAIFFAADLTAFGAMKALSEQGIDIPGDISIFGFDDERPVSQEHNYPLINTVKQPLFQMGTEGIRLLLSQIENPQKEVETLTFDTELVIRNSCSPRSRGN